MSSSYSGNSGVPVEYLMFELGLREGLGRRMADVVLGTKCCGNLAELPEELPGLERAVGYLQMAQEKKLPDSKLAKRAIRLGKKALHKLSKATDPVEKLLPDAERLITMTGEFYKAHRTVIYRLREQYKGSPACKEMPETLDRQAEPEEKDEQLSLATLLRNALGQRKKRGQEPELAKNLQAEIGNRYFKEFASLVDKDMMLDYVSVIFRAMRTASSLMQLPPEELTWLEKLILKKGEPTAKGMVEQLLYIYTSDSALVASFIQTVLGLFDIQDPEVVKEGIAWLEGGIAHLVTSLYED